LELRNTAGGVPPRAVGIDGACVDEIAHNLLGGDCAEGNRHGLWVGCWLLVVACCALSVSGVVGFQELVNFEVARVQDTARRDLEKLKQELSLLKSRTGIPDSNVLTQVGKTVEVLKNLVDDDSLSEETRQAAQGTLQEHLAAQFEAAAAERQLGQLAAEQRYVSSFEAHLGLEGNPSHNATAVEARVQLHAWLGEQRLLRHLVNVVRVAGPDASIADLALLSEENLEELTAAMTHVEAGRLKGAVQTLRGEQIDT
jgi:hypothetical protein